jgi:hypothetical protein
MPSVPCIATTNRMPVSLYINTTGTRTGIIAVYINISISTPGPFAGYPISTGVRSNRAYVYRFGRTFGNIIISSA